MSEILEGKSKAGTTIGLIDAMITTARVVRGRLDFDAMIIGEQGDEYQPIREALKDFSGCAEMRQLMGHHDEVSMKIIHDAAELMREKLSPDDPRYQGKDEAET